MIIEYRVVDMPWLGSWRYQLEKRVSRRWWTGFWEKIDTFVDKDLAIARAEQFMLKGATIVWSSHTSTSKQGD